jgi:hypothetical protein
MHTAQLMRRKAQLMCHWLSHCTVQAPHSYIRLGTAPPTHHSHHKATSVQPPLRFMVCQIVLKIVFQNCMLGVHRIRNEGPTQLPIPLYIQPIAPSCPPPLHPCTLCRTPAPPNLPARLQMLYCCPLPARAYRGVLQGLKVECMQITGLAACSLWRRQFML